MVGIFNNRLLFNNNRLLFSGNFCVDGRGHNRYTPLRKLCVLNLSKFSNPCHCFVIVLSHFPTKY